ncbi:MAG: ATP-binding protein [Alphaproteobacteria bacterium]|nr:ATP-binding protein [Alphaproteobacteria bacterium]
MGQAEQKLQTDNAKNDFVANYNKRDVIKILIVDDRPENLVATRKVLKPIEAEILEARSGNEALSLMLRHEFAVVLLDVQMPEMDGFEVAKLMHEEEKTKDIPIIFVTAINKEEHYIDQAAEIGAVDYIYKPVNSNILRSKVQVYAELYAHQKQLKQLNDILQRNNDELERFAYVCSHDLQEPARMMSSFAEILHNDYRDHLDEKSQKYLDIIHKSAGHMQKMIYDILTFSRVGHESVQFEEVDSHEITENVLKKLETDIKANDTKICLESLPTVQTSKTLMTVLMQNTIGNALKYQDGRETPQITIKVEETLRHWLFSVADNGIGIDPQYADKVFQMFQRIHSKDKYPGTGIGLSTCKKFIELYGGKIWFESELDRGTTFFFTIPKQEREIKNA